MDPLTALGIGSAAAGALGGIFGGDDGSARMRQIMDLYRTMALQTRQAYSQNFILARQAESTLRQGEQAALGELNLFGGAQKQGIGDRAVQNAAMVGQRLGRGIGAPGSSVLGNAVRGIGSDAVRSMGLLDAELARMRSAIRSGFAGQIAGQQNLIGSLFPMGKAAETGIRMQQAMALQGVQDQGNDWLGSLGGGLGLILGSGMFGGGGVEPHGPYQGG